MKFLQCVFLLLLISELILTSDELSWDRRRRRRRRYAGTRCPSPPTLSYTYRSGCYSPYTHGERCTYRCQSGYRQVSGSNTKTCSYGRWVGTNLVCRRVSSGCSSPPTLAFTYRSGCYSPYTNGERCTYRCWSGYSRVSGDYTRTCSGRRWLGTSLVCRRLLYCPTAPPGRTVAASQTRCAPPYTQGETCYYQCIRGYSPISGSTSRICTSSRVWTGTPLICGRFGADCRSSPPFVPNTIVSGCAAPYKHLETCRYQCRPGYSRVTGSTYKRCQNGGWSGSDLICRYTATLPCSAPPIRTWSFRYGCYPPYTHGERCSFACRNGSPQSGSSTRTCNNGVWSGAPLTCVRPNQ